MKYDLVIIGSGIAATALSHRILEKNKNASILMLEAGQKVKMQDNALWQNYIVSGKLPYSKFNDQPYPERDTPGQNQNIGATVVPLAGSRVMTYGGSTIHWGGWSFRLKPEDFLMRTNTGTSINWPIDYDTLEPYYGEAENYIGVSGDSDNNNPPRSTPYPFPAFPFTFEDTNIASAINALGMKFSNVPIARHGITSSNTFNAPCKTTGTCKYCPFGARYAATNFLNHMSYEKDYPNLEIRINSVVNTIDMDAKNKAKGVTYFNKVTKETISVEADAVIVAGGAIESPKLLQRSTSEFWLNGIGNDEGNVGRYFITHPYFIFTGMIPENKQLKQPEMDFPTLCTRHFDNEEEQAKGKFILLHPSNSPQISIAELMKNGNTRAEIDENIKGANTVQIHGMVEIFSEYDNYVTNLPNAKNQIGLPQTIVDYSQSPEFNDRMAYIQSKVEQIFENMDAKIQGKPVISWRADHAACTCRMSEDPKKGVTDKNMKIHGVDNIFVCSNAAFTSTGAINPTLTLTALSLRLADHIIEKFEV